MIELFKDTPICFLLAIILIGITVATVQYSYHWQQRCKTFGVHDYRQVMDRDYDTPNGPGAVQGVALETLSYHDQVIVCIKCGNIVENPAWKP